MKRAKIKFDLLVDYTFHFIVAESIKKPCKKIVGSKVSKGTKGLACARGWGYYIFIREDCIHDGRTLVHELMHLVDDTADHVQIQDTETRAYMMEHFYSKFNDE
jgi:hypothetical protein